MNGHNQNDIEILRILYNEISENLRFFVEWRFKSITRYILTITAIFLIIGWLLLHKDPCLWRRWGFIPFLLISLISFIFYRLEIRNAKIQNMIIRRGRDIEKKMSANEGIYSGLNKLFEKTSYTFLLKTSYIGICILSAIVSVVLLFINTLQACAAGVD